MGGGRRKCWRCGGTGKVTRKIKVDGKRTTKEETCGICQGKGTKK
jgi:DnaJ-class molecular chaperone